MVTGTVSTERPESDKDAEDARYPIDGLGRTCSRRRRMTALSTFDFNGSKVRTAGTHDAPLFCAADACAVLELPNVGQALSRLAAREIESITTGDVLGKNRAISFVTESGLYKLVMRSRKPQAEAFVEWVTSEVLPSIRRKGYYSALEAAQEKQTERLLGECFPKLPSKSAPLFRELIASLVKLRRMDESGNPPWARTLASLVYGWSIRIDGQQPERRRRNPTPNGSHVDHSMFSDVAVEAVRRIVQTGTDFARISSNWDDWKLKMELAFGSKAIQLPMVVSLRALPGGKS